MKKNNGKKSKEKKYILNQNNENLKPMVRIVSDGNMIRIFLIKPPVFS
jgi:hypothetical protein